MPAEKHFDFFVEDLLTAVWFLKYRNKIYNIREVVQIQQETKSNIRIIEIAMSWIKYYHSIICFCMDLKL